MQQLSDQHWSFDNWSVYYQTFHYLCLILTVSKLFLHKPHFMYTLLKGYCIGVNIRNVHPFHELLNYYYIINQFHCVFVYQPDKFQLHIMSGGYR